VKRRAPPAQPKVRVAGVAIFAALFTLIPAACGAGDRIAPKRPLPAEKGPCGDTADQSRALRAALDDGTFTTITPYLEEILVAQGGFKVLLLNGSQLLTQITPRILLEGLSGYEDGLGLGRMRPHVVEVLSYIVGRDAYLGTPHYEPVDAAFQIMRRCDAATTLAALRALLTLEIILPDGSQDLWIDAVVDQLTILVADPEFSQLLEEMAVEDEGAGGQIRVGREAFQLVLRLAMGNVAAPDYDPAQVRSFLEDIFLEQLDLGSDARREMSLLLDLFDLITLPELDIFPHVQKMAGCLHREDPDGAFAGMFHDYMSIESLKISDFVEDAQGMAEDESGDRLLEGLLEVMDVLAQDPRKAKDLAEVASRFINPETSRQFLPLIHDLKGRGLFTEILAFIRTWLLGCQG
jgi:hypothetical protein